MNYSEKGELIEKLAGKFREAPITILTDCRGLTVSEVTDFRRKLNEADAELLVAKNTLARLAVRDTDCAVIDPLLAGPTAFAFGYGDPVAVAKVVDRFVGDIDNLDLKGGVFDGALLEPAEIEKLAKLPGRDELRAKLLALLQTPATQLVRVLQAPAQQMVQVLQARQDSEEDDA